MKIRTLCGTIIAAVLATAANGAERGSFSMGADGVSTHEFTKGGRRFVACLNTKDEPVAGLPAHGFELKECKGK